MTHDDKMDDELRTWLTNNHPDVLEELEELLTSPPKGKEDYNLVDHCDDNYSDLYLYYCEYA